MSKKLKFFKKLLSITTVITMLFGYVPMNVYSAGDATIGSTSGIWTNSDDGPSGIGTNEIRWGESTGYGRSGYRFDGEDEQDVNFNDNFLLGKFTHFNWPIYPPSITWANLKVTLNITTPISATKDFTFKFEHEETENGGTCEYPSVIKCADRVTFPSAYGLQSFRIGDKLYTLKIEGFTNSPTGGTPVNEFITQEQKDNVAYLYGSLSSVLVEEPAISIIKEVSPDNANWYDANTATGPIIPVGNSVYWRYIVQNTGNVALNGVSVVDDQGVTVSCPGTTLASGASMTCTASGTAIAGQYKNTGTVSAPSSIGVITDSDDSYYYGQTYSISGYKYHDLDADGIKDSVEPVLSGVTIYLNASTSTVTGSNGYYEFNNLVPGNYTLTEDLSSLTGTWYQSEVPRTVSITNQNVTDQNFGNYQKASITACKKEDPNGDKVYSDAEEVSDWEMTLIGENVNDTQKTLAPDGCYTWTNLEPGNYSVTEENRASWTNLDDLTYSFGLVPSGSTGSHTFYNYENRSIYGYKFEDLDGDGTKDSTEQHLNGWTIKLTRKDGGIPNCAVSGQNYCEVVTGSDGTKGHYGFKNLSPGTYIIEEVQQTGWKQTFPTTNEGKYEIVLGKESTGNNFGNQPIGSINLMKQVNGTPDKTWDLNISNYPSYVNGTIQEVVAGTYTISEERKDGYHVTDLTCDGTSYGAVEIQTIIVEPGDEVVCTFSNERDTGSIQAYKFEDLDGDGIHDDGEPKIEWGIHVAGQNDVTFANEGYLWSSLPTGEYTVSEDTTDTSWTATTLTSQTVTVSSDKPTEVYFGNFKCGTISGYKWEDLNGNGKWETSEEPAIKDWNITLSDGQTTQTNENGYYEFTVCKAGSYEIKEVISDSETWYQTSPGGVSKSYTIEITSGKDAKDNNFGNAKYGEIWGVKYRDNDGDRNLDLGDLGDTLSGWVINLINPDTNVVIATATTGDDGEFHFKKLPVGAIYTIEEVLTPSWTQTVNPVQPEKLTSGSVCKVEIGNFQKVTITACKYEDADGDLKTSSDQTQVTGWNMTLSRNGTEIETQATGRNGCYTWTNLEPGDYFVTEEIREDWKNLNDLTHSFGTVESGKTYEYKFVNTHKGSLTLIKKVTNDNGGNAKVGDFPLYANDVQFESGVSQKVFAGTYNLSETNLDGYTSGSWDCEGGTQNGDSITITSGQSVICTIENDDIAPSLTLVKKVTNDNGGTKTENDFDLHVTGGGYNGTEIFKTGSSPIISANTEYTISESQLSGYEQEGDVICIDRQTQNVVTHPVTLNEGQNIVCTIVNNDVAPGLTIVKNVINDNGGNAVVGDFDISLDNSELTFDNGVVSGNTTTYTSNPIVESNKGYTLSEIDLPGYTEGTWDCGNVDRLTTKLTLAEGQNVTCTITNDDQQAYITVVKEVVNDNGGTAKPDDFKLTLEGNSVSSGAKIPVDPGKYIAGETQLSGYLFEGFSSDCNETGEITIKLGESKTCTITNNDIAPTLTINKIVINNNGGTLTSDDFDLFIGTTPVGSGSTLTLSANQIYTISESPVNGYTFESFSGDCDKEGRIKLLPGENKVCNLTNNDLPASLTLIKEVKNDDGGTAVVSDFKLSANGNTYVSGVPQSVNAGTYTLEETNITGYIAGDWSCEGGKLDETTLTLRNGESATCTIVNDDKPSYIIVKKTVVNDNGGDAKADDFKLTVDGNGVLNEEVYKVNPGEHTVGETNLPGYTAGTWGTDCSEDGKVTVALGETKTCTITNDDQQAYITVVKKVVNEHEASPAKPDDFKLTLEGEPVLSGAKVPVNPGSYTVEETKIKGYTFEGFSGNCDESGEVTVALGESKTCTLTNSRDLGSIKVFKFEDTDADGEKDEDEDFINWSFTVEGLGTPVYDSSDQSYNWNNVPTGNYTVTEDTTDTTWTATTPTSVEVNVAHGDTKKVYFGNFNCGTISGYKWEDLNGNGNWETSEEPAIKDWNITLSDGQTTQTNGNGYYEFTVCKAGSYEVKEVISDSETWYQTSPGGISKSYTVEMTSGKEAKNNNFGNAKYGEIWGVKYRDNDGDGKLDFEDFGDTLSGWVINLFSNGQKVAEYKTGSNGKFEFKKLEIGNIYTITETMKPGWTQTDAPKQPGKLTSGEVSIIDIGNYENPEITVCKKVDLDGNVETRRDQILYLLNWEVYLLEDGRIVDTQHTGRSGCYTWTNLKPQVEYTVAEKENGEWTALTKIQKDFGKLNSGDSKNYDFINYKNTSISGYKFEDMNADRIWNVTEKGLNGWTIRLTLKNGETPNCAVSGQNYCEVTTSNDNWGRPGHYEFTNLAPGTYIIEELTQTGWKQTYPSTNGGKHEETLGYPKVAVNFGNQPIGTIQLNKIVDGEVNRKWDLNISDYSHYRNGTVQEVVAKETYIISEEHRHGYHVTDLTCNGTSYGAVEAQRITVKPGESIVCTFTNERDLGNIKVYKFEDTDADGKKDENENYINWNFRIYGLGDPTYDETDNSYNWYNIPTGRYIVSEDTSDTAWMPTTRPNKEVFVKYNETSTVRFGNFKKVSITVCKYADLDGRLETEEDKSEVGGWEITLTKKEKVEYQPTGFNMFRSFFDESEEFEDKVIDTQSTDETGCVTWTNLEPGDYSVVEEIRNNWTNLGETTYRVGEVESSGIYSHDFINFENVTLSGYKFEDADADGIWDEEEKGLEGWTIKLNDEVSTTTDENGYYEFENLTPGTYTLEEVLQSGWYQTVQPESVTVESGKDVKDLNFGNFDLTTVDGDLDKIAEKSVYESDEIVKYTIAIKNTGAIAITGTLTDTIPAGLTYKSASLTPDSVNGQVVNWTIALDPLETISIELTTTIDKEPSVSTKFVNNALYKYQIDPITGIEDDTTYEIEDSVVIRVEPTEEGEVLGESTVVETVKALAKTGSAYNLAIAGLGIVIMIGSTVVLKKRYSK